MQSEDSGFPADYKEAFNTSKTMFHLDVGNLHFKKCNIMWKPIFQKGKYLWQWLWIFRTGLNHLVLSSVKWFPDSLCEIESPVVQATFKFPRQEEEREKPGAALSWASGPLHGASLQGVGLRLNYMRCPAAKLVKPRARDEAEQNTGL